MQKNSSQQVIFIKKIKEKATQKNIISQADEMQKPLVNQASKHFLCYKHFGKGT